MFFEDKRRSKRIKVKLTLTVSSLVGQDNDSISLDSPITVLDISKGGIGFCSRCILPLEYFFDAAVNFGNDIPVLDCTVRIIRCEALEDEEYFYGCEIVKKPPEFDDTLDSIENRN